MNIIVARSGSQADKCPLWVKSGRQPIEHVRYVPKADIDSHCLLRRTDRSRTAWRKVGKIRMRFPAKPRDRAQFRHSVALPAAFNRMPRVLKYLHQFGDGEQSGRIDVGNRKQVDNDVT